MQSPEKQTLLIVDDSPISIEILRSLLERKYRLKVALNGAKALQLAFAPKKPDLILLDITMPDMNGYQVSEQLKANPMTRDIPVIFVSALEETLDKVHAFEAGGVDYITKPFEPEEVLARVRTHLQIQSLNRSLREEITLRQEAQSALQQINDTLEKRVQERTEELAAANQRLQQEIKERINTAQVNERLLQQVRNLASYQQSMVEEERTRIARELHDEFGQVLTGMKMETSWLSKQIPDQDTPVAQGLKRISHYLDETIQLVRRVAHELRPGVLDELGLLAALEWSVQEFASRTGIHCKLDLQSEVSTFGRDIDTTVFRICQEALTNIARHAQAGEAKITLNKTPTHIEFNVQDNGKGITQEQITGAKSFGIMGMRERVRIWDGEISFTSQPGQGTTVQIRIPYNH
jgi:signal transduction histidine kinase